MEAPVTMMGPSAPKGAPVPMASAAETGLAMAVRGATRLCLVSTASMASGMPWPRISGAHLARMLMSIPPATAAAKSGQPTSRPASDRALKVASWNRATLVISWVGITAVQHQLLLAIRGHGTPPSIGDVAEHLLLRHHSVVELVDRAERAGLVERYDDDFDQRVVRLRITAKGQTKLNALATAHLEELDRLTGRCADGLRRRADG